ncbi:3'(2'),5'-bisphosphate nucleotidase 1-like [Hydractinia symbiolongicarpus]|uniref:3'(2'),5'-bisphosphate nucleotidase 1-like n=1 Tax=Hydractinia symbiolongicarpus TaxID=13093 RepID=UPI00254DC9FF|nr:3'(2'),5'-bisphosphate nucleotidase 1-like [Hydractinia symbiolongicarpus]
MASNLMKVVASSVAIAGKAGNAIRLIMKSGDLGVIDKAVKDGNFDPQTAADRTAQAIIVASLSKQFPDLLIVGEEEGCDAVSEEMLVEDPDKDVLKQNCPDNFKNLKLSDLVVWVDPLDGTKEFTEGHVEHVTVLIGISAHGKAIAGVVHQPFFSNEGRTIWGVVGLGAFGVSATVSPPGRRIITTTKSHMTDNVQQTIDAMKPDKVLRTGGCGYKVLQVIEGIADAYVFATPGTKKWDTCAPEAVLIAMGGMLTDIRNERIDYSKTAPKYFMNWTGILGTASEHDSYASKIPESIRESLKMKFDEKTK